MKQILFLVSFIFICFGSNAQTELWGVTETGGEDNAGTIFKTDINGQNLVTEFNFSQIDGSGSGTSGQLTQLSDGRYFGMTPYGGKNNKGVIFQYDPVTNVYTKKIMFDGINGKNPQGALIQALDGKLYGMTHDGGTNDMGVIFEYDPNANVYLKLLDFNTTNGAKPWGNLLQAQDGFLYGLTNSGNPGTGTLFQFDPVSHTHSIKYNFNPSSNGYAPVGSLIQTPNGKLYGVASGGGATGDGVIFQFDIATNTYTKKFDFNGSVNGSRPNGSLVRATNDILYGLTYFGGVNDKGVLFQYDYNTNTFSKKVDLSIANGANPWSTLIQATDGFLYGVTYAGGTNNMGVLFQYNIGLNSYVKKIDFGLEKGSQLCGPVMQSSNGNLYGLTNGGANNLGTLFEYNPTSSTFAKKFDFGYSPLGRVPQIALLKANDGMLYGTTSTGGANNLGTMFRYDPITHTHTKIFDFDTLSGSWDVNMIKCRTMIQGLDGKIYGTTPEGGVYNFGVLYQFDPVTLVYSKKYDFANDGNGINPIYTLLQLPNSMIYGVTNRGGSTNSGTIFQFNPTTNVYTKKHGFPVYADGQFPGEIACLNDSIIVGLTRAGGATDGGVIYHYNTNSNVWQKNTIFQKQLVRLQLFIVLHH